VSRTPKNSKSEHHKGKAGRSKALKRKGNKKVVRAGDGGVIMFSDRGVRQRQKGKRKKSNGKKNQQRHESTRGRRMQRIGECRKEGKRRRVNRMRMRDETKGQQANVKRKRKGDRQNINKVREQKGRNGVSKAKGNGTQDGRQR